MSYGKPSWAKKEPNPSSVSREVVAYLQESGQYDLLIAHKRTGDLGAETSNGSKPGASEASSGKLKPFESVSSGKLSPYEAISPGKPGGAYEPISSGKPGGGSYGSHLDKPGVYESGSGKLGTNRPVSPGRLPISPSAVSAAYDGYAGKPGAETTVPLGGKVESNAVGGHPAMYTKVVTRAGKSQRIPRPGDTVSILFTARVEKTGIEFDTNVRNPSNRKASPPLVFQVGTGRVIRGLDQALMTMVRGERATLTIQPEWAYGHQGIEAAGIPPNAVLIFDVELVALERAS
ncbi:FK506-binding protein 2B [Coemansia sp. RSA 1939]|nr:FK506-binding protein 2B [Coemansia sp. RSA 1939]KAJ2593517.1 FK506-binding protein 2B [Coemansia sp. RSA 1804]KAJ2644626.1 FK506-binding protein 2B [Coemansia sp. RSA 1285]